MYEKSGDCNLNGKTPNTRKRQTKTEVKITFNQQQHEIYVSLATLLQKLLMKLCSSRTNRAMGKSDGKKMIRGLPKLFVLSRSRDLENETSFQLQFVNAHLLPNLSQNKKLEKVNIKFLLLKNKSPTKNPKIL